MLLYELALELGVRSTALLDRAHALGIYVDQTSVLTPAQVEELRSAYGKGRGTASVHGAEPIPALDIDSSKPMGTGAIVALVGAGLVVVLLVAYMFANSGDDGGSTVAAGGTTVATPAPTTEPCDPSSGIGVGAIGAGDGAEAADEGSGLPPCSVAGGLVDDGTTATTELDTRDPIDIPRDTREFCKAAIAATEFDTKLFEAANPESLGPIKDVIIAGRDKWRADATIMSVHAPPRLDVPIDRYIRVYSNLVDSVQPGDDDYELAVHIVNVFRTDLNYYAIQIGEAVTENCDKR